VAVGTAVGAPLVVYLLSLWALYVRSLRDRFHQFVIPVAVALIIGAIFTPAPVLVIGLVLAGVVATKVALHVRDAARTEALAPVEAIRV
jgi:urea transporter